VRVVFFLLNSACASRGNPDPGMAGGGAASSTSIDESVSGAAGARIRRPVSYPSSTRVKVKKIY